MRWRALWLCLLLVGPVSAFAAPMTEAEYNRLAARVKAENDEAAQQIARNEIKIKRILEDAEPIIKKMANPLLAMNHSPEAVALVRSLQKEIERMDEKIAALRSENRSLTWQSAGRGRALVEAGQEMERVREEARKAEEATRLAAAREVEAKRIAEQKAAEERRVAAERIAEEKRIAAERVAEERRIAREQAREKRQWTLIYIVGSMLVMLFGLFFALRSFGANVSLSEWSRSFYWLVKASIAVTFALFFLTAVETVFGALSIPDWMRRPLAELLNRASDAIDPEAHGASK